jgi:transcriptional regulator with XRE-family HTH domain
VKDQDNISEIDQFVIDLIRELRLQKGLTQDDIGNIIGISRAFVSDIENTNRRAKYNLRHINALADYFNMSPKDFLPDRAFADVPKETIKTTKKSTNSAPKKKSAAKKK